MSNSLLIAILTDDVTDSALDIAEQEGIHGVTILPASGISQVPIKIFFGLTFKKSMSVLLWITETERANKTAKLFNDKLNLASPHQGLAFTLPLDQLYGLNLKSSTQR